MWLCLDSSYLRVCWLKVHNSCCVPKINILFIGFYRQTNFGESVLERRHEGKHGLPKNKNYPRLGSRQRQCHHTHWDQPPQTHNTLHLGKCLWLFHHHRHAPTHTPTLAVKPNPPSNPLLLLQPGASRTNHHQQIFHTTLDQPGIIQPPINALTLLIPICDSMHCYLLI